MQVSEVTPGNPKERPFLNENFSGDEIELRDLFALWWKFKWLMFFVPIVAGVIAVFFTLRMPNIYQSEALLAPAEESNGGGGGALGQLGGLASLAGVSLGGGETNKLTLGLEVMKSRAFIIEFIMQHDILAPLMAAKEWDKATGRLVLNDNVYNVESNRWVGKNPNASEAKPTDLDAYKVFSSSLQISKAKDSGMITVKYTHISPIIAKQWIEWLIEDLNAKMRKRDIEEASRSIDYLRKQLDGTPLTGMQQVFYQLIEKQMQTIMLANVRDQYVLKIVDPPVIPEEKTGPKRSVIVLLTVLLSFLLLAFCLLLKNVFRSA